MNSLASGNGGILGRDKRIVSGNPARIVINSGLLPLICFAFGVLSAGLLRLLVWARHTSSSGSRWQRLSQGAAVVATVASALLFIFDWAQWWSGSLSSSR